MTLGQKINSERIFPKKERLGDIWHFQKSCFVFWIKYQYAPTDRLTLLSARRIELSIICRPSYLKWRSFASKYLLSLARLPGFTIMWWNMPKQQVILWALCSISSIQLCAHCVKCHLINCIIYLELQSFFIISTSRLLNVFFRLFPLKLFCATEQKAKYLFCVPSYACAVYWHPAFCLETPTANNGNYLSSELSQKVDRSKLKCSVLQYTWR